MFVHNHFASGRLTDALRIASLLEPAISKFVNTSTC